MPIDSMNKAVRCIAFYLPQFHPIIENDEWWGKGFTEWTNSAKANPLFSDHYQPHIPADLGFYDLRLPETRAAQANLAREHGIEGFCYYHYWFAGRQILERPFNEVLRSGEPHFPFCLCWANQTWTGVWHGAPNRILIEQTYPGEADDVAHFHHLLPAFKDRRYIRIEDKPLLVIYRPTELPDGRRFAATMNRLARENGMPGLYIIGVKHDDQWKPSDSGFDAAMLQKLPAKMGYIPWRYPLLKLDQFIYRHGLTVYDYADVYRSFTRNGEVDYIEYPCAIPNWDNTPRSGLNGLVLHGSTPELFRAHFQRCLELAHCQADAQRVVFIKSWNEWAEGNHLEPDLRYGRAYLEVVKQELERAQHDTQVAAPTGCHPEDSKHFHGNDPEPGRPL